MKLSMKATTVVQTARNQQETLPGEVVRQDDEQLRQATFLAGRQA